MALCIKNTLGLGVWLNGREFAQHEREVPSHKPEKEK
jgi:hypothetical protein